MELIEGIRVVGGVRREASTLSKEIFRRFKNGVRTRSFETHDQARFRLRRLQEDKAQCEDHAEGQQAAAFTQEPATNAFQGGCMKTEKHCMSMP